MRTEFLFKSSSLVRVKNVSKHCSIKESLDSARAEGFRQPTEYFAVSLILNFPNADNDE